MSRKNKYSAKKSSKDIFFLIVLLVLVVLIIAGGIFYYNNRSIAPDKLTLCPQSGPLGHFVVLVDSTDPYTFIQREAFSVGLKELASGGVPEGYLLSIYELGEDFKANAQPVFELCNPGTSDGKSELTANLKRIQERHHNEFEKPIIELIDALVPTKEAALSPIFEMFQLVSINAFRTHAIDGPRSLVVYSDMLHHTKEFSMFKALQDYSKFIETAYGQRTRADLKGVRVELNYLMDYPHLQTRKQLHFWEQYFEQSGASVVSVKTLEG